MTRLSRFLCGPLLLMLGACAAAQRLSETAPQRWARWEAHDSASTLRVDHGAWDAFLARYAAAVDDTVRVAYGRVGEADKAALDTYVAMLAQVPVSRLSRPEQFAYWVNLHNAFAVKVVLDHYPVASIRDLNLARGLTQWGPFAAKLVTVEGEELSFDDIVSRILRPIWQEPRVHYLLNPAAVGAPDLPLKAVTAANAFDLMNGGGRAFVNHPRGLTMRGGQPLVSDLYLRYQPDFGGGEKAVIAHLRRFAAPELSAALAKSRGLSTIDFDWTLNVAE